MKDFVLEHDPDGDVVRGEAGPALSVASIRTVVGQMAKAWLDGLDRAVLNDAAAAKTAVDELTRRVDARWPRRGQRAARFALLRSIARLEDELGVPLPKPLPPSRRRRATEPLRSRAWVLRARDSYAWADRLEARMAHRSLTAETLAGLVLASAVLNGLLLEPAAWSALAVRLADPKTRLLLSPIWPTMPWLDLVLDDGRVRRWWPDAVTLGLWSRWHQLGRPASAPHPERVFEAMEAALWPEGRPAGAHIRSARDLAAVAWAPLEDRPGADLPQALIETMLGRLAATSLPAPIWEAQLRNAQPGIVDRLGRADPEEQPRKRRTGAARPPVAGDALDRIGAAIRANRGRRRRKLLDAMVELARQPLSDAALLLVRWYAHLLRKGDQPSSIARYHSAIGPAFVSVLGSADLPAVGSGELSRLYERILDLRRSDGTARKTLMALHAFGQAGPDLVLPAVEIFPGDPVAAPCVRAMALSKKMADAILAAVDASPLLSEAERAAWGAIFLLLWRGGLRIEEALGRTAADAVDDAAGTVHVRAHGLGGVKTDAGRRNVPAGLLMTADERTRYDAFVRGRRAEVTGAHCELQQARLFGSGAGLFETPIMSADRFRAILHAATRAVGGPGGLTPHGLRHAALSLLHLALLEDGEAVTELTGWPVEQIAALRRAFLGRRHDPARVYDALAGLAGHEVGETSSEHYLHFGDLIVGLRLARIRRALDRQAAARAFGLNARSLGDAGTVDPEALRQIFLDRLPIERVGRGRRRSVGRRAVRRDPLAPTPALAWAALDALDRGGRIADAAAASGLTTTEVAKIADRAAILARLMTRKRRRRVDSEKQTMDGRLLPDGVLAGDRSLVVALSGHLRAIDRHAAIAWVIPALLDAEPHHPGARHYTPAKAREWLATVEPVIPLPTWRATLHLAVNDDEEALLAEWQVGLADAITLETLRTQAQSRDKALKSGRVLLVNRDEAGRPCWPPVRLAAFLVAVLDQRFVEALIVADAPNARRRRQAGR